MAFDARDLHCTKMGSFLALRGLNFVSCRIAIIKQDLDLACHAAVRWDNTIPLKSGLSCQQSDLSTISLNYKQGANISIDLGSPEQVIESR